MGISFHRCRELGTQCSTYPCFEHVSPSLGLALLLVLQFYFTWQSSQGVGGGRRELLGFGCWWRWWGAWRQGYILCNPSQHLGEDTPSVFATLAAQVDSTSVHDIELVYGTCSNYPSTFLLLRNPLILGREQGCHPQRQRAVATLSFLI